MKILLRQKCGLGNQLFQYAAGLFYANKFGATLEIIREPGHLAHSFGRPRPFMLSNFCISAPVRELTDWDRLMCSVAPMKKPVAASARFVFHTSVFRQHYLTDGTFLPDLSISRSTKSLYLEGFFQAYQYAQGVEQQIRTEFNYRNPASGKNLELLNQIRAVENSVSVHVRRGDYIVRGVGPQLLPLSYHARAMQTLLGKVNNPTFFVFSDDIAFTRDNLPKGYEIHFVDHNDEMSGHEDLRLMSACRHNIIANSSFSWWGAWLNPNPAKLVCAPESWHNVNPDVPYPDLIPPGWLRIRTTA